MDPSAPAKVAPEDIEQRLLLDAIYHHYHYDFREYAQASLKRRLQSALTHFGCKTLSQLQDRVLHEAPVFTELLQFLTVQVSDMFRDPSYFLALRNEVVPILRTYPSIKVWVAGCSTGEEVYSLAILLHEEGLLDRALIYATDINPHALRVAEQGVFDLERVAAFTRNHTAAGGRSSLSDYYTARYGRVVFDKALRAQMVFSDHSLATDSVFAEVHLVSCRNVLIYFERALQNRALRLFHDALVHRGFMGLGSRESVRFSAQADGFDDFVLEDRIYRKKAGL
ncbi:MAG: CheR family methyltransferase [Achromobacter sp.]|uniref:CheR family methyltransferase n=1 Tax=Achromobacter sp. TaxID=134375 RepID=UPI003D039C4D